MSDGERAYLVGLDESTRHYRKPDTGKPGYPGLCSTSYDGSTVQRSHAIPLSIEDSEPHQGHRGRRSPPKRYPNVGTGSREGTIGCSVSRYLRR